MKNDTGEFLKDFISRLAAHPSFDAADFRLVVDHSMSISVGQKDNELLGPYDMPTISTGIGASLYAIWKDGRVSNVNLNYEDMKDFAPLVEKWRKSAFRDEHAPRVWREESLSADDLSNYKMFDRAVAAIAEGSATPLFDGINHVNERLRGISKLLTVNAGASVVKRRIYFGGASPEPAFEFSFTSCGLSFDLDNVYGDYFMKRRLYTAKDLDRLADAAALYYPAFKEKPGREEIVPKARHAPVVLTPQVADSFLKKYVMSNLYGKSVVERQSKFDISEFRSNEKYFREDLSFSFSQTSDDFEINNIPLTYEGVSASPVHFVKDGRLVTPMLDLKYAGKAGMAPNAYLTPEMFQSSGYSIKVETGEYEAARAVISDLSEGFVVFGILGMHTQDHTSGDFSISAPYSVFVRDGKPEGLVKISLAGNFFEQLNHYNTKFLNWYQEGDSMLIRCQCS